MQAGQPTPRYAKDEKELLVTKNKSPFRPNDEKAFITLVMEQLKKGSAQSRGVTALEYVDMARKRWDSYSADSVYAMKLLFDPLVQPEYCDGSLDNFHCLLVARIDHNGRLMDAPPGYKPPDYQGVHLSHIVAGSPSGGRTPNPAEPTVYLVAYMDILGFESLLARVGLIELHRLYNILLQTALTPNSETHPWSKAQSIVKGTLVPALMWIPIQTAYFSDSILLWVHYNPGHVGDFLFRVSKVFCAALDMGLPMRGAITFGEAIFDKSSNTFLGSPLVEATRIEKEQNWIGITIGASFKDEKNKIPIPPEMVFMYTPPMKTNETRLLSGLVLDWPRVWRESKTVSALKCLDAMCAPELPEFIKKRYQASAFFYDHSEKHQDWFLPEGAMKIKA